MNNKTLYHYFNVKNYILLVLILPFAALSQKESTSDTLIKKPAFTKIIKKYFNVDCQQKKAFSVDGDIKTNRQPTHVLNGMQLDDFDFKIAFEKISAQDKIDNITEKGRIIILASKYRHYYYSNIQMALDSKINDEWEPVKAYEADSPLYISFQCKNGKYIDYTVEQTGGMLGSYCMLAPSCPDITTLLKSKKLSPK